MRLKIKPDFFKNKTVEYIRRGKDGDKLLLIYFMLVGLSENDLEFGGLYHSDGKVIRVSDLVNMLPVSEKRLFAALELFSLLDLIEIYDDRVFVTYSGLFELKK